MSVPAPHFLLFSESRAPRRAPAAGASRKVGAWRFMLEAVDGTSKLDVADEEQEVDCERLELLAVVRGLESLDQPACVTLVTRRDSIARGLRFGLNHWRENGWQWEYFGEMARVKDADLWQRVDRALRFHRVQCRTWRFDPPAGQSAQASVHADQPAPHGNRRRRGWVFELLKASICRLFSLVFGWLWTRRAPVDTKQGIVIPEVER